RGDGVSRRDRVRPVRSAAARGAQQALLQELQALRLHEDDHARRHAAGARGDALPDRARRRRARRRRAVAAPHARALRRMTRPTGAPRIGAATDPERRAADAGHAAPRGDASVDVAVDIVAYALRAGELVAALVPVRGRGSGPQHAFPGGRVRVAESLDDAAARWLGQGLPGERAHLEQLYTFGAPGRDPAARVVSVA